MSTTQNAVSKKGWEIWKTVELGTHETINSLRKAVGAQGLIHDYIYEDLFKRIEVSPVKKKVNLVILTAADLGFEENFDRQTKRGRDLGWSQTVRNSGDELPVESGASYHFKQLYRRALDSGLHLCPSEVSFQLLLQHPDTLKDAPRLYDYAYIGMEPMVVHHPGGYEDDPSDEDKIFAIRHKSISATYGLGYHWRIRDPYWIFVLPS